MGQAALDKLRALGNGVAPRTEQPVLDGRAVGPPAYAGERFLPLVNALGSAFSAGGPTGTGETMLGGLLTGYNQGRLQQAALANETYGPLYRAQQAGDIEMKAARDKIAYEQQVLHDENERMRGILEPVFGPQMAALASAGPAALKTASTVLPKAAPQDPLQGSQGWRLNEATINKPYIEGSIQAGLEQLRGRIDQQKELYKHNLGRDLTEQEAQALEDAGYRDLAALRRGDAMGAASLVRPELPKPAPTDAPAGSQAARKVEAEIQLKESLAKQAESNARYKNALRRHPEWRKGSSGQTPEERLRRENIVNLEHARDAFFENYRAFLVAEQYAMIDENGQLKWLKAGAPKPGEYARMEGVYQTIITPQATNRGISPTVLLNDVGGATIEEATTPPPIPNPAAAEAPTPDNLDEGIDIGDGMSLKRRK